MRVLLWILVSMLAFLKTEIVNWESSRIQFGSILCLPLPFAWASTKTCCISVHSQRTGRLHRTSTPGDNTSAILGLRHRCSRRIGTVIQRIQAFVRTKWEGRNTALHKYDLYDVEKFRTLEAAEIRHYHTQPHLLQLGDQHLCSGSLIKLLRSRPAYQRRWLRQGQESKSKYDSGPIPTDEHNHILLENIRSTPRGRNQPTQH
jgi:hypothetical protein